MIHSMTALLVGNAAHHPAGKPGKGGVDAAIVAMFSEALAAQLKGGDVSGQALAVASEPAVEVASGMPIDEVPVDPSLIQVDDATLAASQSGTEDAAEATPAGLALVVPPVQANAQPEAGVVEEGDLSLATATSGIPAATKNPNVLSGRKILPDRPAVSANVHAYAPRDMSDLPAGLEKFMAKEEGVDIKALMQSVAAPGRTPVAGMEVMPEGARPMPPQMGLAGVQVMPGADTGAGVRQVMQLATPMAQPQWQAEFGEKITWIALRQGQLAELSLNPPSLGSIEVRLNVSGQEAGAQFFSANPVVREAIEAALPRLREMMAEAGLALGEAMVSSESFREREAQAEGRERDTESGGPSMPQDLSNGRVARLSSGQVDLYV